MNRGDSHLEESYFLWLYNQSGFIDSRSSDRTHWQLAKFLHQKEFVWLIPNDDNRVEDGRELRFEFAQGKSLPEAWLYLGCSMFEMLIALARRLAFEAGRMPEYWFEFLLNNLDLYKYDDRHFRGAEHIIDRRLEAVIFRTYKRNGEGSLFPPVENGEDQRQVEIWYQMSTFLMNRH